MTGTMQENIGLDSAGADVVISALEAGAAAGNERRGRARISFRAQGRLELFAGGRKRPCDVVTRDLDARSIGFVTRQWVAEGTAGLLHLRNEHDTTIRCRVARCRELEGGWYDVAALFDEGHEEIVTS